MNWNWNFSFINIVVGVSVYVISSGHSSIIMTTKHRHLSTSMITIKQIISPHKWNFLG